MPRWGRDQNAIPLGHGHHLRLPQCPGGGEIKTLESSEWTLWRFYHSAPVGARSKRGTVGVCELRDFTTVPRWGRDQNGVDGRHLLPRALPQCPGGGEIKTRRLLQRPPRQIYHSAPVGARSKRHAPGANVTGYFTTVPRWGRDQNLIMLPRAAEVCLPQCPGGGEIKTSWSKR